MTILSAVKTWGQSESVHLRYFWSGESISDEHCGYAAHHFVSDRRGCHAQIN